MYLTRAFGTAPGAVVAVAFQIGDLGFRGHQTYPYNRRRRIELPRLYYVLRPGLRAAGAGGGDVK